MANNGFHQLPKLWSMPPVVVILDKLYMLVINGDLFLKSMQITYKCITMVAIFVANGVACSPKVMKTAFSWCIF